MAIKKIYDEDGKQIGTIDDGKKNYRGNSDPGCVFIILLVLGSVALWNSYPWSAWLTVPIISFALWVWGR